MKASQIVATIVVVAVILVGGYFLLNKNQVQPASPSPSPTTSVVPTPTTPSPTPDSSTDTSAVGDMNLATLSIGHSSTLGEFLVASNGMTLYTYSKDTADKSNCTSTCAVNWPAYTIDPTVSITAIDGVNGSMGKIAAPGGSPQVTYNHKPLYFYIGDKVAGDTKGQNINNFTVVKP